MKDVWIVGATSHVAKALIAENLTAKEWKLTLVARSPGKVATFLATLGYDLPVAVHDFTVLQDLPRGIEFFVNCVGFGTPSSQRVAGSDLFWVTEETDNLILRYLERNASSGYVSFSSGAVYGTAMAKPVAAGAVAELALDPIQPEDWYRITKIHQEAKHRAMGDRWIVDLRLFSFFSRFVDLDAGFLMSDIAKALRDKTVLSVSRGEIFRDYIAPNDLYRLIQLIFDHPGTNRAVDTYSAAPISKSEIIKGMIQDFGLLVEEIWSTANSPTGAKPYYFSQNQTAEAVFGYAPRFSSREALSQAVQGILHNLDPI